MCSAGRTPATNRWEGSVAKVLLLEGPRCQVFKSLVLKCLRLTSGPTGSYSSAQPIGLGSVPANHCGLKGCDLAQHIACSHAHLPLKQVPRLAEPRALRGATLEQSRLVPPSPRLPGSEGADTSAQRNGDRPFGAVTSTEAGGAAMSHGVAVARPCPWAGRVCNESRKRGDRPEPTNAQAIAMPVLPYRDGRYIL
jgi:hypothetical protein